MKTYEEKEMFEQLAKPLIEFLNDNYNPNTYIIIDSLSAEIITGEMPFYKGEFVKNYLLEQWRNK